MTSDLSRLRFKSSRFWWNCRLLWPYAAFPQQVEHTLSDLPVPRQLSFYSFKRFMPQLPSSSQTEGLCTWEIPCAVSQATNFQQTCFSTAMLSNAHVQSLALLLVFSFFSILRQNIWLEIGAEKLCKIHCLPCHKLTLPGEN